MLPTWELTYVSNGVLMDSPSFMRQRQAAHLTPLAAANKSLSAAPTGYPPMCLPVTGSMAFRSGTCQLAEGLHRRSFRTNYLNPNRPWEATIVEWSLELRAAVERARKLDSDIRKTLICNLRMSREIEPPTRGSSVSLR